MKPKISQAMLALDSRTVPVTVTRKRMKNIRLRVSGDGVAVSAPFLASDAAIGRFLRDNAAWVEKKLAETPVPPQIKNGSAIYILGSPLTVVAKQGAKKSVEIRGGALEVSLKTPDDGVKLVSIVEKWVRGRALDYFQQRIDILYPPFAAMNIPRPTVSVKKMTSRWGSCNRKDRKVSLSAYLFGASADCIDYVVLHELCHLVHDGHGKDFHTLLESLMPDCEARRKKLNGMAKNLIPR